MHGVDVSTALSSAQWSCLRASNVSWASVRSWHSYGAFDKNSLGNLHRATAAGLQTDIYMFPCRSLSAALQAKSMVEALSDAPYGFAWLDIEQNPSATCGWDSHDMADNCKFVVDLVNNLTAVGVGVGVYTSEAEWLKAVGPRCTAASFLPLWYAHYDQRDTCDDFRSFGGWRRAYAKQFSDRASASTAHCGAAVDSSVGCRTVPDEHRRWSVDAELIGLQSSSISSGEVVVADASSGRVRTQVQDRAAASTASVASDHVGGVIWLFEEGYILRPFFASNFTLGSPTIVNLDNCTAGGACLQELHWRSATRSVVALSLGWSGRGAVLELDPHTGLVRAMRAVLPTYCGILEGGTALQEDESSGQATLYAALDVIEGANPGMAIYAIDLATGANSTLIHLSPSAPMPSPLAWLHGLGLVGVANDRLVHVTAAAIAPLPARLPAAKVGAGALLASPAGHLYVGFRANASSMPVVVLRCRATSGCSTVTTLRGLSPMALLATTSGKTR